MTAYVLILGLGQTGQSAVRYFVSQGQPCCVYDTRRNPANLDAFKREFPTVPVFLSDQFPMMSEIDWVIKSPGVNPDADIIKLLQKQAISIVSDIHYFAAQVTAPIIAITGTNGKSTTTMLVTHILNAVEKYAVAGGNIGTPVFDLLQHPEPDIYVLEVSSFQLDDTFELNASVGVVLNIAPDHLDRYGTLAAYQASKLRLYEQCKAAVISADMPWSQLISVPTSKTLFSMQSNMTADFYCDQQHLYHHKNALIALSDLPIATHTFAQNCLAALAVCHYFENDVDRMVPALKTFTGLAHRCEHFACIKGVDWYDDSKATNFGAVIAAVESIAPRCQKTLWLLLGGQLKESDFTQLIACLARYKTCVRIISFGQDAKLIATQVAVESEYATLKKATQAVQLLASENDSVLLAPGGASFDEFTNFAVRGQQFKLWAAEPND